MSKITEISRRDFIKITAAAGGALFGGKLLTDLLEEERLVNVRDTRVLMGTMINLAVVARTSGEAKAAIDVTFAEMRRQIEIFDHRLSESPVAELNQNGVLEDPPHELVFILEQALSISKLTNGAFDVTVKPLLDLYRQAQPDLPQNETVQETLSLVGYKNLSVSTEGIIFSRPGMALTLDGIAKGFIVDVGVAELKKLGYQNVFVEAGGDLLAVGEKESNAPWKVGVRSPRQKQSNMIARFEIRDRAMATSGDYLYRFSPDLAHHHIIDPRKGYSPLEIASSTVIASTCLHADALATALTVLGKDLGLELIDKLPDVEALLVSKDMSEYGSKGI
jgi:thiamine biosynthesis lipoprotein